MMPETLYHFIAPHLKGYSEKEKEKLIKMIRGEDRRMKLKPMTAEQKRKAKIEEEIRNYFLRAQKRNAEKNKKR